MIYWTVLSGSTNMVPLKNGQVLKMREKAGDVQRKTLKFIKLLILLEKTLKIRRKSGFF